MAEEGLESVPSGQFEQLVSLVESESNLQLALVALAVGLIAVFSVYFNISKWLQSRRISYTNPTFSLLLQRVLLPLIAIAIVSTITVYVQLFELFDPVDAKNAVGDDTLTARQTFSKILNTVNILVIGYAIAQLIPVILAKKEKSAKEREDFEKWRSMRGFPDDPCGQCDACEGKRYGVCDYAPTFFDNIFEWVPPSRTPPGFSDHEFQRYLETEEGRKFLEKFRTTTGQMIGSYSPKVSDPFKEWQESERNKYRRYLEFCLSGDNASGRPLKLGAKPQEVFTMDDWKEAKRDANYEYVTPGGKPPGYLEQKKQTQPPSIKKYLPVIIFGMVALSTTAWWGVDLFVLATATGGVGIGVGFAMQETLQNYFAYVLIRKDKIVHEGDRVQLDTGYNGYVHRITSRVTYIRHGLNESLAIIPTRQLINSQVINFTKEFELVPAKVEVAVSYDHDPREVIAVLMKAGNRLLTECKDDRDRHVAKQLRCPYLDENKPSCGCDQNILIDIQQPRVRLQEFDEYSMKFLMFLYVRDYGAHFKAETDLKILVYEEFKNYGIKIPKSIRTIYEGDQAKEIEEITKYESQRKGLIGSYGLGDVSQSVTETGSTSPS